ncbi:MAG: hypothetical protein ACRCZI_00635 [Cetobacterium sp.]
MASKTDIVNLALAKIGHTPLQSLDLDESDVATVARAIYPLCLDDLLTSHTWNFATTRTALAELVYTPVSDTWGHAYQLPSDCLRLVMVEPAGVEFAVEGSRILTNEAAPLVVVYLQRADDAAAYSPQFTMALAYRMAMEFASGLSGKDAHLASFTNMYLTKLQEAKTTDGQEAGPIYEDHAPLSTGRIWTEDGWESA